MRLNKRAYLKRHSEIDFYVDGEGEIPFVELFRALEDVGFDARRLKASGTHVPSVQYVFDGQFVRSESGAPDPRAGPGTALAVHDGCPRRVLRRPADADGPNLARLSLRLHVLP